MLLHLRFPLGVFILGMSLLIVCGNGKPRPVEGLRRTMADYLTSSESVFYPVPPELARAFAASVPGELLNDLAGETGEGFLVQLEASMNFERSRYTKDTLTQEWGFYLSGLISGYLAIFARRGTEVRLVASIDTLVSLKMCTVRFLPGQDLGMPSTIIRIAGFVDVVGNSSTEILGWDGQTCKLLTPSSWTGRGRYSRYSNLAGTDMTFKDVDGDGIKEIVVGPFTDEIRHSRGGPPPPGRVFKFDKARGVFVRLPKKTIPPKKR